MAVLDILTYPNPELKKVSQPIERIDDYISKLIEDLCETLYASPGCIGIAAPQVGALVRLIVIDASRNKKVLKHHGKQILINPKVVWEDGSVLGREGCLSLPDFTANVTRPQAIRLTALNEEGAEVTLETEDMEARVILHEADHLDGILFLDRVASLKTDVFRRKRY
jgi:peptide deformylase